MKPKSYLPNRQLRNVIAELIRIYFSYLPNRQLRNIQISRK